MIADRRSDRASLADDLLVADGEGSGLLASLRQPLYRGAFFLWMNAAVGSLAGFAFWTLAARLYDAVEVGLASAAIASLTLLAMLSPMGLGVSLMRFLPESGPRGPALVNAVFTVTSISAAAAAIVYLVGLPLWAPRLGLLREQPAYAAMFIVIAIAASISVVQMHVFVTIRKAHYNLVQVGLVQLCRLILAPLLVTLGAFGIVASAGLAAAIGTIAGFFLLARGFAGYGFNVLFDPPSVFRLLPFAAGNHVADILLQLPSLILPLMVVGLIGSAEAAYFYISWFLGYVLTSTSMSLGLSLLAEGSHGSSSLRSLSREAVVAALAVAAVGGAFVLLLGDKLLLAYGRDYAREGSGLLRIMAIAASPAAVVHVYLGALRVAKRVKELVAIAALMATITVALSAALLPVIGLNGAGVSYAVAQMAGVAFIATRLWAPFRGAMAQRVRRAVAG